jgi:hypothetical protein
MIMPAPGTKRHQEAMLESAAGEVSCKHRKAPEDTAAEAAVVEPGDTDQQQAPKPGVSGKAAARHSKENVAPTTAGAVAGASAHVSISGSKASGSGAAAKSSAGGAKV